MRKIVVAEYLSLDGVMENPMWTMPYLNHEIAQANFDGVMAADALLLGRVTGAELARKLEISEARGARGGSERSVHRLGLS
jgi:hypothetical protein